MLIYPSLHPQLSRLCACPKGKQSCFSDQGEPDVANKSPPDERHKLRLRLRLDEPVLTRMENEARQDSTQGRNAAFDPARKASGRSQEELAVGQNQWYNFHQPFWSILVGIGMFTGGTGF